MPSERYMSSPVTFPIDCPNDSRWIISDNHFNPDIIWKQNNIKLIKESKKRKIIFSGDYYLKFFKTGNVLKRTFRDPAWKEFTIARHLDCYNLTAQPAAWCSQDGWSCFVARHATGINLSIFIERNWHQLTSNQKNKFSKHFANLLIKLANIGFFQPDFHLNNILYDHAACRFTIIDLHRAKLYPKPLSTKIRSKQLALILPQFLDNIPPHYIMQCASRLRTRWTELNCRKTRFDILKASYSNMRKHWTKKGLSRKLNQWNQTSIPGGYIISCPEIGTWVTKLLCEFSKAPVRILKQHEKILKDSHHTLCFTLTYAGEKVFVKGYRSSGHFKSLSYFLRPPKILKLWERSWLIALRRIPVMVPISMLQHSNPWKTFYGALIYQHDIDAENGRWKQHILEILPNKSHCIRFFKNLAKQLWIMHEKGIVHGDCKISNFIVDPTGRIQSFFDVDSVSIVKNTGDRQRLSDIVCMAASLEKLALKHGLNRPSLSISRELFKCYLFCHIPWEKNATKLEKYFLTEIAQKRFFQNPNQHRQEKK